MKFLLACVLCGAVFVGCAWGLYAFVHLKLGAAPPCEVSNTCGWLR